MRYSYKKHGDPRRPPQGPRSIFNYHLERGNRAECGNIVF